MKFTHELVQPVISALPVTEARRFVQGPRLGYHSVSRASHIVVAQQIFVEHVE